MTIAFAGLDRFVMTPNISRVAFEFFSKVSTRTTPTLSHITRPAG